MEMLHQRLPWAVITPIDRTKETTYKNVVFDYLFSTNRAFGDLNENLRVFRIMLL